MKVATCLCSIRGNFRPLVYVNSCTHFWAVLTEPICSCGSIFQYCLLRFSKLFQDYKNFKKTWLNREFHRKCHNFAYNWKITFCRRAFFSNKWKMWQPPPLFQKVFSCCFAAELCLRSHLQNLLPRKNSLIFCWVYHY